MKEPEAVRQVREWRSQMMEEWEGLSPEEITARLNELGRRHRKERELKADKEAAEKEAS